MQSGPDSSARLALFGQVTSVGRSTGELYRYCSAPDINFWMSLNEKLFPMSDAQARIVRAAGGRPSKRCVTNERSKQPSLDDENSLNTASKSKAQPEALQS